MFVNISLVVEKMTITCEHSGAEGRERTLPNFLKGSLTSLCITRHVSTIGNVGRYYQIFYLMGDICWPAPRSHRVYIQNWRRLLSQLS